MGISIPVNPFSRWAMACMAATAALGASEARAQDPWLVLEPNPECDQHKHIVLVSGDEEYRSEEALTALARILSGHHGFRCTVLFAIDPETGAIDPEVLDNIPGLEALESADLMVLFTRFRNLPDEQMVHFARYLNFGKPILGIRTATHAFRIPGDSAWYRWDFAYGGEDFEGGFGRQVLGETWVDHHGAHGSESTRGVIAPGAEDHPIVRGIDDGDIWGPTDVYELRLPLSGDGLPLVLGQVLAGMAPTDPPVEGQKNDPMMPIAWTRSYQGAGGHTTQVFTSTIGAAVDLRSEGVRRLLVNAAYWLLGCDVPAKAEVGLVGEFKPRYFGVGKHQKGVKPTDLRE